MADFLSTGVSALQAFQRALDTTSHNIANVGTEGYSRQITQLVTRPPQQTGAGWIGSGVEVSTVKRQYDELLAQQARLASSSFSRFDAFATQADRVNNLFSATDTGLSATLQNFANAVQDVADSPSSIASRQVLLSQAGNLVERFKSYDSQLTQFDQQVETSVTSEVSQVNTLANGIARLNANIAEVVSGNGQPPNDLLDQRDHLIDQLATHLDVSTNLQADGTMSVFIGSGQALVIGGQAAQLKTVPDAYDSSRHGVALTTANGPTLEITSQLSGGTLGGVLDFRSQILDPTKNSLGRISVALADVINQQHRAGIDLAGAAGLDLFSVGAVQTLANSANAGTGALAVTRANTGALTEADYTLQLTASGWSLKRNDTGATVTLSGAGTAASPFTADGLSIVVSGTAQTGDRFLIQPTRTAVTGFNVLISDPARIAAAAPIKTNTAIANTGTGNISAGQVLDATNPQLRSTVNIDFLTPTTYSINGAGSFAYTSGSNIDVNGWRVQISGTPAAGDRFTVSDNSGGSGDNRNALALADSLKQPALDGGTVSLNVAATRLVGTVGVAASQAQANRSAQQSLQKDTAAALDSVSGVNLDEEAANLLRYQQAYQAAAQLIHVASTLFDTLLAAAR